MEKTIEVVVEGGKATAAPPLGPALGPLGVNITEVVDDINEKTSELEGMKVPVKVIVDTGTKDHRIEVGKPSASALIIKELNIEKGSSLPGKDRVGDLTNAQVKKIAKAKFGSDDEPHVNQIKGTCRSMGITIGEGEVTEEELKAAEEHKEQVMEEGAEAGEAPAEGEGEPEEKPAEGDIPEKKGEKEKKAGDEEEGKPE